MLLSCEGVVYRILQLVAWRILGVLVTFDQRFEKFFCDGAGFFFAFLLYFFWRSLAFPQLLLLPVAS